MAIIHDEYQQNTQQWVEAHCGIPTASEFKNLVTDKMEIRSWKTEMPNTFLARKLAEAWGGPLPAVNAYSLEQGHILEARAIPTFEFDYEMKVRRVGFVTTDDGRVGCSPDGLINEDGGLEAKSPELHTHIGYLLTDRIPDKYQAQVHGCMYVTGRQWWRFYSYRRNAPKLCIHINRNEDIQETLRDALTDFLRRFDEAWARLVEKNGGPPPKREKMVFADDIAAGRAEEPEPDPNRGITP